MAEITTEQLKVIEAAKYFIEKYRNGGWNFYDYKPNTLSNAVDALLESEAPSCEPPVCFKEFEDHILKSREGYFVIWKWIDNCWLCPYQNNFYGSKHAHRMGYSWWKPAGV